MGQIQVQYNVNGIEGLCVITPAIHGDSRGYFMETYNGNDMKEAGLDYCFVQDNQSASSRGVLRGLHFQKQFPQTKLVRVIRGAVFDVAVDLRENSETYGKYHGEVLTAENRVQFLIPRGFAHGGEYRGNASGEGYQFPDGTPLKLSDKDQKWDLLRNTDVRF